MVLAVFAAAVMALAGVLIGYAVTGTSHTAAARPGPAAIHTGAVTGHLAACTGLPVKVITPGAVTVLRGTVTWKLVSPGTWRLVLPTEVVASEHISNNYDQMFRFALPPGKYVLVGRYDGGNAFTSDDVSVSAGKVIREDLPDVCG
jgi:ribose/xylose/arabinose/galactoside ABC-type transport system permease subunit